MNQVWHIFRKDVRHFWLEILISIVITAAFAVIYPYGWLQHPGFDASFSNTFYFVGGSLASILAFLVPVTWWLLITRVVQDENLVGDRQFWVTRPYEWKLLLAAKILFLAAFLYLPIFVTQCILLHDAGFHPWTYLPGLFFNLLLITGVLVVPLFSLAAVTSSLVRVVLAFLLILLYVIAVAFLVGFLHPGSANIPGQGEILAPFLLGIPAAAFVVQYATRRLWISLLLLVTTACLIGIVILAYPEGLAIEHIYQRPMNAQDSVVQISFAPDELRQVWVFAASEKRMTLSIPLHASGIADGYAVIPDNVQISIDTASGAHWESDWQQIDNQRYISGSNDAYVLVGIDRSFYDLAKSASVTLHLRFALTQVQSSEATSIALPGKRFTVPEFGVCTPVSFLNEDIFNITCRSALRQPHLTYVTGVWFHGHCSDVKADLSDGVQGAAWVGNLNESPAEFGITSVQNTPVMLSNNMNRPNAGTDHAGMMEPRHLCPGTPLTFTRYSLVRRVQSELAIPNVRLPERKTQSRAILSVQ